MSSRSKVAAVAGAAIVGVTAVAAIPAAHASPISHHARHVLLLSVDGLHANDLAYYVAAHPRSALAALVRRGTDYTHAQTTFPSDSFPGMVAQATGGGPGTTGVYYDDTYDHQLDPPGTKDCSTATPGTEVPWTEQIDRSQNPITLDAGQGLKAPALKALATNTRAQTLANAPAITRAILAMTPTPQSLINPASLPVDPATCLPMYPHNYLRVNTIFDVARAHNLRTAWSDKHAAYEILGGPSGTGVQDLFTPEINSIADKSGDDWSKDNALTQEYDGTKVAAVLNEIDGRNHQGTAHVGTPAIFGMNFQTVSTAQKLPSSDGLAGGYTANGRPGPLLQRALGYVNREVGQMVARISRDGLAGSTTIIISAKHGQAPQNPATLRRVDDGAIINALNKKWATKHQGAKPLVTFSVNDDGMLIWLSDRSSAAQSFIKQYLLTHTAPANRIKDPKGVHSTTVSASGLTRVYTGRAADKLLGAPADDPHAPDLVGIAQPGVVYTSGVSKIAEHGGDNPADRNVALLVAQPGTTRGTTVRSTVNTTQIAPTILDQLGLNPDQLQAVRREHSKILPRS
ncbi:MAG: alkaline phosphatase family protein [Allobranchiibius sp.]